MIIKYALAVLSSTLFLSSSAIAQAGGPPPQMTLGNGEMNSIEIEGLIRSEGESTFSTMRVDGANVSAFRGTTSAITFPAVQIEKAGWLVLHPVIDGRPDGDMVSGFAYLNEGQNENVTIQVNHPADAGDRFLVMLHSDVDEDRVFDFVFVEDGINVEDKAVFEGMRMIAHVFEVPE